MRILWVKTDELWPPNSGSVLRSFHTISELALRHQVIVLTTHPSGEELDNLTAALSRCEDIISIPPQVPNGGAKWLSTRWSRLRAWCSPIPAEMHSSYVPALRRKVESLLRSGNVDVCVADYLISAPNVVFGGPAPVVLFQHNVEHLILKRWDQTRGGGWWHRVRGDLKWRRFRRYEARACAKATMTIAVSAVDRDLLARDAPDATIRWIPTGVDTRYFSPSATPEVAGSLVFSGTMDWFPNEDAMRYFINDILPSIRREIPDVSLTVVGKKPTPSFRAMASNAGVHVTGTVDDVRPYVAAAAVFVVPLRVGSGTRLKIFEALAMGKAVVSTPLGAEGLPLVHGRDFLCADGPDDFARAVISLLRDPGQRNRLGAAGRELVETRFSWPRVVQEFEALCEEAVTNYARRQ
jgi:glycosyltransferase involved in cell wall biosynthesis